MKKTQLSIITLVLSCVMFFNLMSAFSFHTISAFAQSLSSVENVESCILSNDKASVKKYSHPLGIEGKVIRSYENMYNLDGAADYIYVEFENGGYAIYAQKTMELLEYSLHSSPFQSSQIKYYGGPANYFHKKNNKYINVASGEYISLSKSEIDSFSQKLREIIIEKKLNDFRLEPYSENDSYLIIEQTYTNAKDLPKIDENELIIPTGGTGKLIANAQYFLTNPTHGNNFSGGSYGNNNSGTCGPVSAQLLLGYNNYYNHRGIIPDRFLNGYNDISNSVEFPEENPNHCTDPMAMTSLTTGTRSEDTGVNSFYSEIVTKIMKPNTSGSTNREVKNGISKYLEKHLDSNEYTVDYDLKGWSFGWDPISSSKIISEIDSERPIIISMSSNLGGSDHFVVGYGYQDYTYPDGQGTYSGYVVHFGWSGDNNVWVNSSWCDGYVSLKINHTHNYDTYVKTISNTGAMEYRCSECGHRTDEIIRFAQNERYTERVISLQQNSYKDYYVRFFNEGCKVIQTFGLNDTIIEIYSDDGSLLKSQDDTDDEGYSLNAFTQVYLNANTTYKIRVKLYNSNLSGITKLAIFPAIFNKNKNVDSISCYEDILNLTYTNYTLYDYGSQYYTHMATFTPTESGVYTITLNSIFDNYLYIIDPRSSSVLVEDTDYNDDIFSDEYEENLNASITRNLQNSIPYLMIYSPYDPSRPFNNLDEGDDLQLICNKN